MAIRLIEDDERYEFVYEGAKLIYARPSPGQRSHWIKKHTNAKGIVNWVALSIEAIQWSVSGWQGVVDGEGNEVEFDKEELKRLPADVIDEFILQLGLASPEEVSEKKA